MKQNILNMLSKLILETKLNTTKTTKKQASLNSCRLLMLIMFTKRLTNPLGNIHWI